MESRISECMAVTGHIGTETHFSEGFHRLLACSVERVHVGGTSGIAAGDMGR